jgi:hypothetical protein
MPGLPSGSCGGIVHKKEAHKIMRRSYVKLASAPARFASAEFTEAGGGPAAPTAKRLIGGQVLELVPLLH